jgi:hypothetical protein
VLKNDVHDLGLVLESRVKLVVIESWDEPRVLETLTSLAIKRGLGIYTWAVTEGLQRLAFGGEPVGELDSREPEQALRLIKADPTPNIYVLCDLHPFLVDNPKLVRLLKEIAMSDAPHKPTLVLVSHAVKLPAEVQRYAALQSGAADRGRAAGPGARRGHALERAQSRRAGAHGQPHPAAGGEEPARHEPRRGARTGAQRDLR